jgi:hypothetical protein
MASILAALKIALTVEPLAVGVVSDLIDLWNKHKSGQHVSQEDVDNALVGLKNDVKTFDDANEN